MTGDGRRRTGKTVYWQQLTPFTSQLTPNYHPSPFTQALFHLPSYISSLTDLIEKNLLYTTKLTIIILEVILVYKISLVSTSVYFVYLTTMNWHLLSIIHLLLGLACLITSVILFRLREYPEIRNFSLHIFISAIWLFAYSMQLSSSTLDDLLLWESIAFSAMFFIPATYHYTTLRFIGYLRRVKWHQLVIIFLPSVLFG